jgi:hypothetical protein
VVRKEFASFLAFSKRVDAGELIEEADRLERKDWDI